MDEKQVESLILENRALVYYVIKKEFSWVYRCGIDEDVVGDGMLGLVEAAGSYDSAKGAFSTYAALLIKRYILSGMKKSLLLAFSFGEIDKVSIKSKDEGVRLKCFVREFLGSMRRKRVLTRREMFVLKERFGLDGSINKTLKMIGLDIGVTEERTRQVLSSCLMKLREHLEFYEGMPYTNLWGRNIGKQIISHYKKR